MTRCLGRLPHSEQRLATLPRHLMSAEAPPPPELPRPDLVWTPTLCRNTVLPTCCIAGLMNSARLWTLTRNGFDLADDESALLRFFCTIAGCEQTDAAMEATGGLVMLDVLERAAATGFEMGQEAPLVPTYTVIDPLDPTALRDAVARRTAYVGVTLYECDMDDTPWVGPPKGEAVGGHCLTIPRYSRTGFTDATWGAEVACDDAWLLGRIAEAYSVGWTLMVAP